VGPAATFAEVLAPLRADPARAAILLDVDGTLAPIVRHAADAHVPESTRGLLIELAGTYGVLACVSGRRAADARRIVALGGIAYVGNHGAELLLAGASAAELSPEVECWVEPLQRFAAEAWTPELDRLRVRLEDKSAIVALHWRGAPDEDAARAAVMELGERAREAGFWTHEGRKVLELRPPLEIDKGRGIRRLLSDQDVVAALYAGDDRTDLDAFRALDELVAEGRLAAALRVAVRSEEAPSDLEQSADLRVDGPAGVCALLQALRHESG